MYKGAPVCLYAGCSAETLQARRQWDDIFRVVQRKNANQEYYIW